MATNRREPTDAAGIGVHVLEGMSEADMAAWRAEFESIGAIGSGDAGQTRTELAAAFGVPNRTMGKVITDGLKAGKYIAGKAPRVNSTGERRMVPVYRLA
jgi:hypothetical protein